MACAVPSTKRGRVRDRDGRERRGWRATPDRTQAPREACSWGPPQHRAREEGRLVDTLARPAPFPATVWRPFDSVRPPARGRPPPRGCTPNTPFPPRTAGVACCRDPPSVLVRTRHSGVTSARRIWETGTLRPLHPGTRERPTSAGGRIGLQTLSTLASLHLCRRNQRSFKIIVLGPSPPFLLT